MDNAYWFKLSKAEQIGNIGSEIARAKIWKSKNNIDKCKQSLIRALELLFLTLGDKKWGNGLREITRFYEVLASIYSDQNVFDISLSDLEYFCVKFVIDSKNKTEHN